MRTSHGLLTVESTRLPIVDIAYHTVVGADDLITDFREAFAEYGRLARRGQPLAYLLDMRDFDPLLAPAAQRRHGAEVYREYVDILRPVSVGEARVITSPVTRGIVTAYDWLTGANKWPCRQVASLAEGEAWLRERLAQAGPRRVP